MKYFFSFLLGLFIQIGFLKADHIVGGELQLLNITGSQYAIHLNFYFNDITGLPEAKDSYADVSIFRKYDNALIRTITLNLLGDDYIPNSGTNCSASDKVRTRLIRYGKNVELTNMDFASTQGYYMSWERCCRNHTIDNIEDPHGTAITIYLEFPPLNQFKDSSPAFKPLFNSYGCKDTPFYFDFSATDKDGDSLVYSLKTPIRGHGTEDYVLPIGLSAPYDSVTWKAGYGAHNAIPGNPSLTINPTTGILYAVPSETGLFVFAVACEEYRKGKKIGVVYRDFQFLIDDCPKMYPPQLSLLLPDNTTYIEGDTITIDLKNEYCYPLSVVDSTWNIQNAPETIFFIGSGQVKPNVNVNLDATTTIIGQSTPVAQNKLCIKTTCTSGKTNYAGIYKYQVIVADRSCPMPLMDTITVIFYIKPIPNHPPQINPSGTLFETINVGQSYSLLVNGTDEDPLDQLNLQMLSISDKTNGMSFSSVTGLDSIASLFTWTPSCDEYKTDSSHTTYFIVKDNHCLFPKSDTLILHFSIHAEVHPFVFFAPNLVTPNGDAQNQFFEIPDLPQDDCFNRFEKVEIFNRWGSKVFESHDRNFAWNAAEESDGLYFYNIIYKERKYKNWVEVVK